MLYNVQYFIRDKKMFSSAFKRWLNAERKFVVVSCSFTLTVLVVEIHKGLGLLSSGPYADGN